MKSGKLPYYYNANEETFDNAKFLRKNSTEDFYGHKVKLVVEADGPIHDLDEVKIKDENRNALPREREAI